MKRFLLIATVGLLAIIAVGSGILLQSKNTIHTDPAWKTYESQLQAKAQAGKFSGVVMVAKDGKPLLQQAYGLADASKHTPNDIDTKFCIASMGKMFTGVAIGQLVAQGKLSLDDKIGSYVQGLSPEIASQVTIGQLLSHTSGLGDVALGGENEKDPPRDLAGLVSQIKPEKPQFTPGSQSSYSNDGFILLGAAIEKISGQSYESYLQDHIFQPAGMKQTGLGAYYPGDIQHMALGGQKTSRIQVANPSGGAYSTAGDMLKFAQALTSHKLLDTTMTNALFSGTLYSYGFGKNTLNGIRIIGHNGGTPGYESQLDIMPDIGYVAIILTNQDGILPPTIIGLENKITNASK
jgi:CubicO group peptidase (beta-lactamase class C family)